MANLFTMDSFGALDQSLEDLIMEKVKRQPAKPRQSVRRAVQGGIAAASSLCPPSVHDADQGRLQAEGTCGRGVWRLVASRSYHGPTMRHFVPDTQSR